MTHKPIQLKNISLSFPHKICFEDFNAEIHCGDRIAIIGRNGSGKSTLLKMLQGLYEQTEGTIKIPEDVNFGYVPQIIKDHKELSGGQKFNVALSTALAISPSILLLDEPMNHLDLSNRKSLMRMLRSYDNTLISVSHDIEFLQNCIDIIWHIDGGKIHIFSGNYDDYMREVKIKRHSVEQKLSALGRQKRVAHQALMQEQVRAKKSRAKGEKSIRESKSPRIISNEKAKSAEETSGKKKKAIHGQKNELLASLSELRLPDIILPKFSLNSADIRDRSLLSISQGSIAYGTSPPILEDINLTINSRDRFAIRGDNGSGKSTLIKAILGDESIVKEGNWCLPKIDDIGYLDQHYGTLDPNKTVLETASELLPNWSHEDIRRHLNSFLFRKNEEVNASVSSLSGGERARLSLAQIAANTPRLLILDEITNNIDLETRQHVIEVLKNYPGAMILVSHDEYFLAEIGAVGGIYLK